MSYTVDIVGVATDLDAFHVSFRVLDGDEVVATHTQGFPRVPKLAAVPGKGVVADDRGDHELVDTIEHEETGEWEWPSLEVVREALANYVRDVVATRTQAPPVGPGDTFEV